MSKTPFEVRLDVMKMAQDMLEQNYNKKNQEYQDRLQILRSSNATPKTIEEYINKQSPKMYSADELITTAQSLISFVNDNTTTRRKQ